MKTLQLDCPGIALRIRKIPNFNGEVVGVLRTDSIVDVLDELINGFYVLADGAGFVIAKADGIQWVECQQDCLTGRSINSDCEGTRSSTATSAISTPRTVDISVVSSAAINMLNDDDDAGDSNDSPASASLFFPTFQYMPNIPPSPNHGNFADNVSGTPPSTKGSPFSNLRTASELAPTSMSRIKEAFQSLRTGGESNGNGSNSANANRPVVPMLNMNSSRLPPQAQLPSLLPMPASLPRLVTSSPQSIQPPLLNQGGSPLTTSIVNNQGTTKPRSKPNLHIETFDSSVTLPTISLSPEIKLPPVMAVEMSSSDPSPPRKINSSVSTLHVESDRRELSPKPDRDSSTVLGGAFEDSHSNNEEAQRSIVSDSTENLDKTNGIGYVIKADQDHKIFTGPEEVRIERIDSTEIRETAPDCPVVDSSSNALGESGSTRSTVKSIGLPPASAASKVKSTSKLSILTSDEAPSIATILSSKSTTIASPQGSVNSASSPHSRSSSKQFVTASNGQQFVVPSSPTATRDTRASVSRFMDFDVAEMDFSDRLQRPFGWSEVLNYRVSLKETVDKNNGLSTAEIEKLRPSREAEEDLAMLQELKVAIRIQTFESRNPVAIYPKNFHSALSTVRGGLSSGNFSFDSPKVSATPRSGISSNISATGGSGSGIPGDASSVVNGSGGSGTKAKILSRHGSLRELMLNQNFKHPSPSPGSKLVSPSSAVSSPGVVGGMSGQPRTSHPSDATGHFLSPNPSSGNDRSHYYDPEGVPISDSRNMEPQVSTPTVK